MDTVTTLLINAVKMAIAFLLAFFPLQQLAAQDAGKEKLKTMRIKMIKEVNGQTQLIDTTVQAAGHAELLQSVKSLKGDTALLRRFQSGLATTIKFDTTVARFRDVLIIGEGMRLDTAAFRALHGDDIKAYRLERRLNDADLKVLPARISNLKLDTLLMQAVEGNSVIYLKTDSTLHTRRFKTLKDGDVVKLRSVNPNVLFRSSKDSAGVFGLHHDVEVLSAIAPAQIERIIVHKGSNAISIDSLLSTGETKLQLKVIQDEKTGKKKVYRIDENGKEVELKGEYLKLDHGNARVMVFLKASVEDITTDDKEALRKVGAAVETKKKEALGVEKISFYPNPNNGRFNLNFSLKDEGTTRVSVMDRNGDEVFVDTVEKISGEYNRQIDLTPFGRGIYYLQIAQGRKYHTKKILVQ